MHTTAFEPQANISSNAPSESAHPLALALWGVLRHRSQADKMLVLNACERRLGRGDMPEKQEQAYFAVSQFVEAEGHVPHATEYDGWRTSDEGRRDLPSASFVRNAFGSWQGLRAAFGTTAQVDVLSSRLTSRGAAFSDAELFDVVRAWARDTDGMLGINQLQTWLDSKRPGEVGLARWPKHYETFLRFREFDKLLQAAGVWDPSRAAHRGPAVGRSRSQPECAPGELRTALLHELQSWATRDDAVLFQRDFISHLQRLPNEHPLSGVPNLRKRVFAELGGWPRTLADAGLAHRSALVHTPGNASLGELPEPGAVSPTDTNDLKRLGEWVRLAAESGPGAAMSYPQYERWRRKRLRDAVADGRQPEPIPTFMTLRRHLGGSWFTVKVRAGVPGAEEYAASRIDGRWFTPEQAKDCVRAAARAKTRAPGSSSFPVDALRSGEYKAWREAKIADYQGRSVDLRIPNADLVRKLLGGPGREWSVVLVAVFDEPARTAA